MVQSKQEVGDNLRVCVLDLLSEVTILTSLVAVRLVKLEKQIFRFFT